MSLTCNLTGSAIGLSNWLVTVTIPTAAIDVFVTVFSNGTTVENTVTRPLGGAASLTSPGTTAITWNYNGVDL